MFATIIQVDFSSHLCAKPSTGHQLASSSLLCLSGLLNPCEHFLQLVVLAESENAAANFVASTQYFCSRNTCDFIISSDWVANIGTWLQAQCIKRDLLSVKCQSYKRPEYKSMWAAEIQAFSLIFCPDVHDNGWMLRDECLKRAL